uniref:Uncharacterized protein n=1 Tax=Acrobeloides nanus TaxID=290746 RepID=A0A914CE61_9BILA
MDKTEFNPLVESQESQLNEHGDDKRATNTRNPYSWLNTDKRSKNPYSWMSSFYDTGKPIPYYNRYMSKKSPRSQYAWMSDYKRTRNPYSWMNFMD